MPLAKIEIEQIEGNRWVAEVEAGVGIGNFKRLHLDRLETFEDVMSAVRDAYYAQVPPPAPPKVEDLEAEPGGAAGSAPPVEIPEDIADQHHRTRIALANKLLPEGQTVSTAAEADQVIAQARAAGIEAAEPTGDDGSSTKAKDATADEDG